MEPVRTRNDLNAALVRFCIAIEEHRRTPEGRVRTAAQFLAHFFCVEDATTQTKPDDRIFSHMPKDVRGPILSAWGIRGAKAAVRDDDAKVVSVVFDALVAGDLDADAFESGIAPKALLAWVPLASFWSFWRAGAINKAALLCALTTAYELRLLDARAFFESLKSRGGELTSTDVLGNAFTKDDLIEWVRKIHASADASPKGMLEAAGWEKIVQKAPTESLLGALDTLAARLGLADPPPSPSITTMKSESAAAPPTEHEHEHSASDGETPAGAEVEISTSENNAPKTDPPAAPARDANDDSVTDLAKTGPYAVPSSTRAKLIGDEDEEPDSETKLYRHRPLQRR